VSAASDASRRDLLTRRRFVADATAAAAGIALSSACGGDEARCAVQDRTLRELDDFVRWLRRGGAQGYIGEVGWPANPHEDASAWAAVADAWYLAARKAGLWVTYWAAGERWPASYLLAAYRPRRGEPWVGRAARQARVLERYPSRSDWTAGIAVAGGAFGAPDITASAFSNVNRGTHGVEYAYPDARSLRYLAGRGHRLARIDVRWERLQPQLGGPLDAAETERVRQVLRDAEQSGLAVVLDLHNFGAYHLPEGPAPIGSPAVPVEAFAAVWTAIAIAFRDERGLAAHGLMNEPVAVGPPAAWEQASVAALRAIRATGDTRPVMVAGGAWSSVRGWRARHRRPWVPAELGPVRYEAHHYWDRRAASFYEPTIAASA